MPNISKIAATSITAALVMCLYGCALGPPVEADGVIAYWCATNQPERPTHAQYALYSDAQKRAMDTHNTYGAKRCGWKP